MFAIPIAGAAKLRAKLPRLLPLVAGLGFLSTLFSSALFTYPYVEVANPSTYTMKILGTLLISNLVAACLYWLRRS